LFTDVQTLVGGSGNDTFRFLPAGSVSGIIVGSGGTNKLDYSLAGTTPAFVELSTAEASRINGNAPNGFFGIQSLIGNPAVNNTLVGPDADTLWTISSANCGKVGTVLFTNFQILVGGAGVDVFKFIGTGSAGLIDGGGAPAAKGNWLDYSALISAVSVNLQTGSATRVGGGAPGQVFDIQNVHGSNGGSTLTGDNQGNILIGGTGNDVIFGGAGASLLIGDKGADQIFGGSGSDILIGDSTIYDTMTTANENALMGILAEWQSGDLQSVKFHDINTGTGGGLNGTAQLNFGKTVKDDSSADTVTAAPAVFAFDWFFQGKGDTLQNFLSGDHLNNV
jgi:Ca2+-binding RTX toxin-like protein